MIEVKQTVLHDPDNGKYGNCLSAVIASLLHIDIESVPMFISDNWIAELNTFLRPYGLAYILITNFHEVRASLGISGCYHEIAGNTQRSNDVLHACCAVDGATVFDPHPSDAGLTNITGSGLFIALQPWVLAAKTVNNAHEPANQGGKQAVIDQPVVAQSADVRDAPELAAQEWLDWANKGEK